MVYLKAEKEICILCREFKTRYEVTAEALLIKLTTHQSSSLSITVYRSTFIRLSLHVIVQKQQAVHIAGGQRWEFYCSPRKYAITIPISSPKLLPFPMGIPWEFHGNGNSHSHAHLYAEDIRYGQTWTFLNIWHMFTIALYCRSIRFHTLCDVSFKCWRR